MSEDAADCHPKVFISYSHDNEAHRSRVLGLAERLRKDGFETLIDQYVSGAPPEGWHRWMLNGIDWADFVLVVCSEPYYHRFRGHTAFGVGRGVDWEGAIITNELYDQQSVSSRFVPVLFDAADSRHIPEPLRAFSHYILKSERDYSKLIDYLAGAAGIEPGQLGPPPDRKRRSGAPIRFDESIPSKDPDKTRGRPVEQPAPEKPGPRASKRPNSKFPGGSTTPNEQRLQVVLYAIIALIGFTLGTAVLGVMVWNAEKLVALGLIGNLYYIVLIPLGLSAAAFLFGVLKSYAHYRGKHLGGVLELGGPVVAFSLVVLGGFVLVKSPQTFPLTVYVHGEGGPQDVVLRNSGYVTLDLGPDRRREPIGGKGQAFFPAIPATFRGQEVFAWVESDSYETPGASEGRRLKRSTLYLPVNKKGALISGSVQDENGDGVAGAQVEVAGSSATTNATGRFELSVRGKHVMPEMELYVRATGYATARYRVVPGGNETTVILRRTP